MDVIKGTSRRIWLTDEDMALLKKISEKTHLSQTTLLSQITTAGLDNIAAHGCTFQLPLKFRVVDSPPKPGREA